MTPTEPTLDERGESVGDAAAAALDRTRPPEPGPMRALSFPDFERFRLANGLDALICPQPRLPLVVTELLTPAGAVLDPTGLPGLAQMTADLVQEGTESRTGEEISRLVEGLGGGFATGATWDIAFQWLQVGSEHLTTVFDLMTEMAAAPTFPEEEIERLASRWQASFLRRRDQPAAQANLWLGRAIYGRGEPYGQSAYGFEDTVEAIGRDAIADFFRRYHDPARGALVVVGDVDTASLLPRLEETFGRLPTASTDAPAPGGALGPNEERALRIEPRPGPPRAYVVDRPGATQTELRLGHASVPRKHPDFHALLVLNALLGGKFTSRLNLNLRERRGFTYGVHSGFSRRLGPGPFTISSAVSTAAVGESVGEVLKEVQRLRDEPPGQEELTDSIRYLVGTFPTTLQTLHGIAVRLERMATFGFPNDFYDAYPGNLAELTPDDIQRASREHLHPERMAVVAVGPREELVPQLEEHLPVEVVEAL